MSWPLGVGGAVAEPPVGQEAAALSVVYMLARQQPSRSPAWPAWAAGRVNERRLRSTPPTSRTAEVHTTLAPNLVHNVMRMLTTPAGRGLGWRDPSPSL